MAFVVDTKRKSKKSTPWEWEKTLKFFFFLCILYNRLCPSICRSICHSCWKREDPHLWNCSCFYLVSKHILGKAFFPKWVIFWMKSDLDLHNFLRLIPFETKKNCFQFVQYSIFDYSISKKFSFITFFLNLLTDQTHF